MNCEYCVEAITMQQQTFATAILIHLFCFHWFLFENVGNYTCINTKLFYFKSSQKI